MYLIRIIKTAKLILQMNILVNLFNFMIYLFIISLATCDEDIEFQENSMPLIFKDAIKKLNYHDRINKLLNDDQLYAGYKNNKVGFINTNFIAENAIDYLYKSLDSNSSIQLSFITPNISQKCSEQIFEFVLAFKKQKLWAFKRIILFLFQNN